MRTVSLVLILLGCGLGCYGSNCFPVQEGKSCTLTCKGDISDRGTVIWQASLENGTAPIANCRLPGGDCTTTRISEPNRFQTSIAFESQGFGSTLKILNVTSADRDRNFSCITYREDRSIATLIETFNLTQVYYPPDSLNCQANLINAAVMNISCHTPKVYPKVSCELVQAEVNRTPSHPKNIRFQYQHFLLGKKVYYSASCYTTIRIAEPGKYKYEVRMIPIVGAEEKPRSFLSSNETNEVTVSGNQSLTFDVPSPIILCDKQPQSTALTCSAFWFRFPFKIVWVLDGETFEEDVTELKEHSNERYFSLSSTYYYKPRPSHQGQNFKCEVYYSNGTFVQYNEKKLDLYWAPSLPQFTHDGENVSSDRVIPFENREHIRLMCRVYGGWPSVLSVHVECRSSNKSVIILDKRQNSSVVTFDVEGSQDLHDSTCVCTASHVTQCQGRETTIRFFDKTSGRGTPTTEKKIVEPVMCVIAAIILLFLLGALVFIWRKWKLRCSDYICFSKTENEYTFPHCWKFTRDTTTHDSSVPSCAQSERPLLGESACSWISSQTATQPRDPPVQNDPAMSAGNQSHRRTPPPIPYDNESSETSASYPRVGASPDSSVPLPLPDVVGSDTSSETYSKGGGQNIYTLDKRPPPKPCSFKLRNTVDDGYYFRPPPRSALNEHIFTASKRPRSDKQVYKSLGHLCEQDIPLDDFSVTARSDNKSKKHNTRNISPEFINSDGKSALWHDSQETDCYSSLMGSADTFVTYLPTSSTEVSSPVARHSLKDDSILRFNTEFNKTQLKPRPPSQHFRCPKAPGKDKRRHMMTDKAKPKTPPSPDDSDDYESDNSNHHQLQVPPCMPSTRKAPDGMHRYL